MLRASNRMSVSASLNVCVTISSNVQLVAWKTVIYIQRCPSSEVSKHVFNNHVTANTFLIYYLIMIPRYTSGDSSVGSALQVSIEDCNLEMMIKD